MVFNKGRHLIKTVNKRKRVPSFELSGENIDKPVKEVYLIGNTGMPLQPVKRGGPCPEKMGERVEGRKNNGKKNFRKNRFIRFDWLAGRTLRFTGHV